MTSDADRPIFTASEILAYRRASGVLPDFSPPRAVMFVLQKGLAKYVLRHYPTRKLGGFMGEFYLFKQVRGMIAFSTGFGIGAPVVAGLAEEFIALGIRYFVLIGLAGSLQPELLPGSLVICTHALCGDGVSQHYVPADTLVESSAELRIGLSRILKNHDQNPILGPTWSTDAPYRELRKVVLRHQQDGILAVEMEASALLSVTKAMNRSAVAAFSIADQLTDGRWRMDVDLRPAQRGLEILFDSAFEYLMEYLKTSN